MPVPMLSANDRMQITELYARYAWAVDAGDTAALLGLLTTDAVVYGHRGDAIAAWHERFKRDPAFPGSQHYVGQIRIERWDGTRATARAYVARLHRVPGTTNASPIWLGYYTDSIVRIDGHWRFQVKIAHPAELQAATETEGVAPSAPNAAASMLYDLGARPAQ